MPTDRAGDLAKQHRSVHGLPPRLDLAQVERGRRCSATLPDQPVEASQPKVELLSRSLAFALVLKGGEAGEPSKLGLVGARITRCIWTGFTALRIPIFKTGTVPTLGRFGPTWAVFDPFGKL
jgi:hypothetical protein